MLSLPKRRALSDATTKAKAFIAAPILSAYAFALSHSMAMAETGGDNANVRGALQTNQDALTAVNESTFTQDGVENASQNATNALLAFVGFLGIAMAAWGGWKLYKIASEGEQARDSMVGPVLMVCFGGLMTCIAIVAAIFPNLFFGQST